MSPKWLQFNDESSKRNSVLSVMSSARKPIVDDAEVLQTPVAHPLSDRRSYVAADVESAGLSSTGDRATPRKRYSMFARSAPMSSTDAIQPAPPSRMSAYVTQDYNPTLFEEDEASAPEVSSKEFSREGGRRDGKHDTINRWMRRVERSSLHVRQSTIMNLGPKDSTTSAGRKVSKSAISAPFDFQHVTHTLPRELPKLDLVSDTDLSLTFWAASAHQTPQRDLRGIKVDDIDEAQRLSRPMSTRLESRPSSPEAQASSSHEDALFTTHDLANRPLRATRSLSNTNIQSSEDASRRAGISRSVSLASLIAERRNPPTMVHPALRPFSENAEPKPTPPLTSSQSINIHTANSETCRNLDVVPEELEAQSPIRTITRRPHRLSSIAAVERSFSESIVTKGSRLSSPSSIYSDSQETNITSQDDTSVPSLSSGETWEEDVDFCYNMEAESTCDFQYGNSVKMPWSSPQETTTLPLRKPQLDESHNVSPRVSIARRQRNKAPTNMLPILATVEPLPQSIRDSACDTSQGNTLPEIKRLSSLLDLPMLHTPTSESSLSSPGKISIDTVFDLRPSRTIGPMEPDSALKHYSAVSRTPDTRAQLEFGAFSGRLKHQSLQDPAVLRAFYEGSSAPVKADFYGSASGPAPTLPLPFTPNAMIPFSAIIAARRATVAAAPQKELFMRRPETPEDRALLQAAGREVQHSRSATPPRSSADRRLMEQQVLRDVARRSVSSSIVHSMHQEYAVPKAAEKFPVWI